MVNLSELEAQAMTLSHSDRAKLATQLLVSLHPVLDDEDDGIAEAMQRRKEMEDDPNNIISLEQLQKSVGR